MDALAHDMEPAAQEIDLGLSVAGPGGVELFTAGGIWHRRQCQYLDKPSERFTVRLVSSQINAAQSLLEWFAAYDARNPDRLALVNCVDERRGGKTFWVCIAILAFALRYPSSHLGKTRCWLVTPTFPQQVELHETLAILIPASWWRDKKIRYYKSENVYRLATGAEIWIKSADRPEGLKWGAVSAVAVNEAQQVAVRAIMNIIGSNIDNGGLTVLAMNPPETLKGAWAFKLHKAIQSRDKSGALVLPFAAEVPFPSSRNETIDQAGRKRYMQLAQVLDEKAAQRDGKGLWLALRDVAYPCYQASHVKAEPTGWIDFTAKLNALTGMVNRGRPPALGAAMDFQRSPYCAFVELKCYLAPPGVWVPAGTPVYVVRSEVCNDEAEDALTWTEKLLCEKVGEMLTKRNLSPSDFLLIADATGKNQGASANQRGEHSDPDDWSWPIIEKFGWEPHGPIERKEWGAGSGRGSSELITKARNPKVRERLSLHNELLRDNRVIFTHDCPLTAEAHASCAKREANGKPYGKGSHLTDCVGYILWVWEQTLLDAGLIKVRTVRDAA